MTIHAKNCESNCNTFQFMNFYSQRAVSPPSDAPDVGISIILGI